jgi:probable HAF family extracellular repeat protein
MAVRVCAGLILVAVTVAQATAGEFQGLGGFPGANIHSSAVALSGDGSVVIGSAESLDQPDAVGEAFLWTKAGGMTRLDVPGDVIEQATDVSADGLTVTGLSREHGAVLWKSTGVTPLAPLFDPNVMGWQVPSAISADGKVAVGRGLTAIPEDSRAAVWPNPDTGVILSYSGQQFNGASTDVSGDGSVVVGWMTFVDADRTYTSAFHWTEADGVIPLGPGGGVSSSSGATGVSADGQVIVGSMINDIGLQQAFRWTEETGLVPLGDLPGGRFSAQALGVSGDGQTIVGRSSDDAGETPFIWTEKAGMRNLADVLRGDFNLGSALNGWTLARDGGDLAISADGTAVAGTGLNPAGKTEAWRAVLSGPWLPGDANFDHIVNLSDFGLLKANFGLGTSPDQVAFRAQGNFDGDRDVDLADFGILKADMGTSGNGLSLVPEPASWLLGLLGGFAVAAFSRRKTS